jgi:ElaB/YqjD/DUF883 family membrane-anchored ribosome-binding protein
MMERTAAQSAALAKELRNVVRQAEELVIALSEDRDEALTLIRNRVSAALAAAKLRLTEMEENSDRFSKQAAVIAQGYGRENPWTVVAVGAALGLIVGAWVVPQGGKSTDEQ